MTNLPEKTTNIFAIKLSHPKFMLKSPPTKASNDSASGDPFSGQKSTVL